MRGPQFTRGGAVIASAVRRKSVDLADRTDATADPGGVCGVLERLFRGFVTQQQRGDEVTCNAGTRFARQRTQLVCGVAIEFLPGDGVWQVRLVRAFCTDCLPGPTCAARPTRTTLCIGVIVASTFTRPFALVSTVQP